MSFDSVIKEEKPIEVVFDNPSPSSSEDPPIEQWSSRLLEITEENPKIVLYKEGLYDPGSGEICAQYIAMSDSSVWRHPYYNYPAVVDPGIMTALQKPEPQKIYTDDGQELYLDLCKQMDVMVVRQFHRGLSQQTIDLKYYGINSNAMRSMTMALINNSIVTRLDLTSNYLNFDACYHIGALLKENRTLQELILSGCKIQGGGLMRVAAYLPYRSIELLDLSSNDLRDSGFLYLTSALSNGAVIRRLNLSHNSLTAQSGLALAAAIEFHDKITHLDLSWNNIFHPKGSNELLRILSMSKVLVELNMAWNALTTGAILKDLLTVKTLSVLDLSNNRLSSPAAVSIAVKLYMAKKLKILDISNNPFTPRDAYLILSKLAKKNVKLVNLIMRNINVTTEFVHELEQILKLPHRKDTKVVYGEVLSNYNIPKADIKTIVMKRLHYLTAKASKKCKLNIAVYFLQELKTRQFLSTKEMLIAMKLASAPVNENLVEEVGNAFPGPKSDTGGRSINLLAVAEYIKRLWPDAKCPPTPPPEPEPVPEPPKKKGGKDAKKGGKDAKKGKKK